jgi:hypothetical protein
MVGLSERFVRIWTEIRRACTLSELSGGFGDLGTLLPIITALSVSGQVSALTFLGCPCRLLSLFTT